MVKPILVVREEVNGVWQNADQQLISLTTNGDYQLAQAITGERVRIFFQKASASDHETATSFKIDNFRVSRSLLVINEENNYYPFGLKHKGYNNALTGRNHKYGFGGKEEQEEVGLEWIDFGWRNYEASLGRWMNIDPLAEEYMDYSPFNSMMNNPLSFIDPDGRAALWVPKVNDDGTTTYVAEEGDSADSLSEQYGIDQKQAEKITGTTGDTEITEGTEVSGEQVEQVTGSDVLKLDLASKQAKGKEGEQRIFDQFLFARDYEVSKGGVTLNAGDFYSNLGSVKTGHGGAGLDGTASLTVDGTTFDVLFDIYLQGGNGLGKSRSTLNISVAPRRNAQYGTPLGNPTDILLFPSYKDRDSYDRPSAPSYLGSLPKYSNLLSKRVKKFTKK